jgi:hypothetical protein
MLKTLMVAGGALTAVFALAALQPAVAADKSAAATAKPRQACFFARDVNSFSAAGDRTVYVKVGVKDVYRLDLFNSCPDIDWNWSIALQSRGSDWICSPMDATIIARSPIGPQRCEVDKVTKLTPEDVAALPRKARP